MVISRGWTGDDIVLISSQFIPIIYPAPRGYREQDPRIGFKNPAIVKPQPVSFGLRFQFQKGIGL